MPAAMPGSERPPSPAAPPLHSAARRCSREACRPQVALLQTSQDRDFGKPNLGPPQGFAAPHLGMGDKEHLNKRHCTAIKVRTLVEPEAAMSMVSSPTDGFNHKISGIPCVAAASRYTAPVHIDVGGAIYTSSLETLTKHPESKLARMFNGSIPIVLDSLGQHYFIDRDGKMFRHVLNFLRTNHLSVPGDFAELELLLEEAKFYDIPAMVRAVEVIIRDRDHRHKSGGGNHSIVGGGGNNSSSERNHNSHSTGAPTCRSGSHHGQQNTVSSDEDGSDGGYECVALNVSPDLGERITLSGERALVEEIFPEISQALMDSRSGVAWNQDARHVIRFPLNGYCKLNSMQAITRLLNHGFRVVASNGGGVEGQQFSEYLFCRKALPMQ